MQTTAGLLPPSRVLLLVRGFCPGREHPPPGRGLRRAPAAIPVRAEAGPGTEGRKEEVPVLWGE